MNDEWKDLTTMQDVDCAQADGWEIKISMGVCRGRPRQPKMKEVKMECFMVDGVLQWRDEKLSILGDWIRQPHLDMIARVPE